MTDLAISIENLSKRYRIGQRETRHETLIGAVSAWARSPIRNLRRLQSVVRFDSNADAPDVLWGLRGISLEVRKGEVVGVIGRNGAGKSTLLKILSRITEPTSGRIVLHGRVASLLEVGTGFHPELTGRENVYLNGTLLGMSRAEVSRKFDEIVAFSGVERFIDTPVKRYSSGMQVRLAFAVAAHLDPEILLIDEVLAVGDAAFQKRCLAKMDEVASQGRTVLFVTHQMALVRTLCTRSVLLSDGQVEMDGPTDEVISRYLGHGVTEPSDVSDRTDRKGNGHFQFTGIEFIDQLGNPVEDITAGDELNVNLYYRITESLPKERLTVSVRLKTMWGDVASLFVSDEMGFNFSELEDEGRIRLRIPRLLLRGGAYTVELSASSPTTLPEDLHDLVETAATLQVHPGDFWGVGVLNRAGPYGLMDATLRVENMELAPRSR